MTEAVVRRLAAAVTLEEAVRLGFGGWLARVTDRADPRPEGVRLKHRLVDAELLDAARALSRSLDAAGVPHAVARGVALLGPWYRPGERETVDVDCYVPAAHRAEALAVLSAQRYVVDPDQGAPVGMGRGCTCTRPGALPVTVDLHWGLPRADRLLSYGEPGALDPLWSHTRLQDALRVPDPAAHLGLVLHHLVHHDLLHARGLVDALLLAADLPATERPRLEALTGAWRVARVRTSLERGLLDPVAVFRRALRADPAEAESISPRRIRQRLALLDRRRDAPRLLRDIVFPPRTYLRWRWPASGVLGGWWRHVRRQAARAMFRG